ncbi:hypothetical protein CKF54_00905 [Psittacicella hinzii]|uniref:Phage portal protein n=1 Tax=Psittacicella hinzii TaxID=2028575 RepID=A0A3A1Y7Y1_9GAMM|nr:phage portal protein [Psittacicella hinzii]RIY34332.1 hypothetical protein CKF54_00905 [Psittacicella hinzii]
MIFNIFNKHKKELRKAEEKKKLLQAQIENLRLENELHDQSVLKERREKRDRASNLYDAARPSTYHKPQFDRRNINDTLAQEGLSLMQQARNAVANNPLCVAIINQYQALLVGKNGYSLQPQPLDKNGQVDEELAKELSIAWQKFCLQPVINSKELSFTGLLNHIVARWLTDGDVCLELKKDYAKHEFKVRMWTAESLEYSKPEPYFQSNSIPLPIEVNELGMPVRYNFKDRLLTPPSLYQYVSVEAENVLHIAEKREPEQLRGVSILAPVLKLTAQINIYASTEINNTSLNGKFLGILTQASADTVDDEPDVDMIEINDSIGYFKPPNGFNFNLNNAQTRTNPSAGEFIKTMTRMVASGVALDAESISNSFESSYSAARQSMIYTEMKVAKKVDLLISAIIRPLYSAFVNFYLDTVKLGVISKSDYHWIDKVVINKPRLPSIDPVKDATANKLNLQLGVTTLDKLANELGVNSLDNLQSTTNFKHICEELGIPELYYGIYEHGDKATQDNQGNKAVNVEEQDQDQEQEQEEKEATATSENKEEDQVNND